MKFSKEEDGRKKKGMKYNTPSRRKHYKSDTLLQLVLLSVSFFLIIRESENFSMKDDSH